MRATCLRPALTGRACAAQVIAQAYPWLETHGLEACEGMLPRSHYGSKEPHSQ